MRKNKRRMSIVSKLLRKEGVVMGKHPYTENGRGFAHHFIVPVLAILAVGVIGMITLRMSSAASKSYVSAKNYYNTLVPSLSDEMSSLSDVQSKWTMRSSGPSGTDRQALYNPPGVTAYKVENGLLSLIAQRHCVANISSAVSQGNASTATCAKGMTTKYSAGRLESKLLTSGTFLIEIRAKMPSTPAYGVRSALWMVNVPPNGTPAYCGAATPQTNLSEFDILEWYSDGSAKMHRGINKPTSSTHILCSYNAATKKNSFHSSTDWVAESSNWYKKWHVYSLRYNGSGTQYFIDGKLTHEVKNTDASSKTRSTRWNKAPTEQQWAQAVQGMSWKTILQEEVFTRAKNSKKFPSQTTLIDYVHVYKHV
jgi:hypothetical protein